MKKILIVTASFSNNNIQLQVKIPDITFSVKGYSCDVMYYDDQNTPRRFNSLHPRLKGKIPKMMEWFRRPGYDYYIWIDSKFTILEGFLQEMCKTGLDQSDLFLFRHPQRTSISQELSYMADRMRLGNEYLLSRYEGEAMEEQVAYYLATPEFRDEHLFAGGCFMYSSRLVANRNYNIMSDWLLHNTLFSIQDQLSLPYLIQKHKIKYEVYPWDLMDNPFLHYRYSF